MFLHIEDIYVVHNKIVLWKNWRKTPETPYILQQIVENPKNDALSLIFISDSLAVNVRQISTGCYYSLAPTPFSPCVPVCWYYVV